MLESEMTENMTPRYEVWRGYSDTDTPAQHLEDVETLEEAMDAQREASSDPMSYAFVLEKETQKIVSDTYAAAL